MTEPGVLALEALGLVFVVGSMVAMGLSLSPQEIGHALRRWKVLLAVIAGNFLVVPAVTFGLTLLIPLPADAKTGFLVLAFAAGAPFLPKLAQFARGSLSFAVGLMLVLMVLTVLTLPFVLPALAAGAYVSAWSVAQPLILLMLVPMGVAFVIRTRIGGWAERSVRVLNATTTVSLFLFLIAFIAVFWNEIAATIGNSVFLFALVFVLAALGIGYLLGGGAAEVRRVASLGTAQRNVTAGILVAVVCFPASPLVLVTVLTTEIVGLVVLTVCSNLWGRRSASGARTPTPPGAET